MERRLKELERIYRTDHARFVRVAAAITRRADTAAEAVQEAFARAIQRHAQFRGEAPLEVWVWRAVVNEAKRAAASAAPARGPDVADAAAANGATPPNGTMRELVAALPERQRIAIFLRYYADLDYRTISDVLGVETGTVSATLAAAHRNLREAIEGVTS